MADSLYLVGDVRHHSPNGQTLPNLTDSKSNPPPMEEFIFPQSTSTSTHQRHDSLVSCSSSAHRRPSSSTHQAESQPCLCTSSAHISIPMDNCMARSTSQYSSASSCQRPHRHDMHRASHDSTDFGLPYNGLNMSRSYSGMSQTLDTVSQSFAQQLPLSSANWYHSRLLNAPSNTLYEPTAACATNVYHSDMVDFIGDGRVDRDEGGAPSLHLMTQINE